MASGSVFSTGKWLNLKLSSVMGPLINLLTLSHTNSLGGSENSTCLMHKHITFTFTFSHLAVGMGIVWFLSDTGT